jgi:aldehyde:ferredoxin oxidoreductase
MSPCGWMGNILRVNLSDGKIEQEPLREELRDNYIGGRGINSRILYSETSPDTDPLGPENTIIIGTGPVNGTLMPTSNRFTVSAKSPLTGILGDANAGGFFGPELKYAGYDHIVIKGCAEKPMYLWIDDGRVELKDARHLWGKHTCETESLIKREIGDKTIHVLSIGQAGENLVKIAGIINDEEHAAARCGLGAVLGSKRLKAVAVRGSKTINIAHPARLIELVDEMYKDYRKSASYHWYTHYGGTVAIIDMCKAGSAPVKNYMKSGGTDLDRRLPISHDRIFETHTFKDVACHACPLACDKWTYVEGLGRAKHPDGGSFHGAIWEIYDYPFMVEFNQLCDLYGMDLYSVQMVTAAAMEWYEKGVITKQDTGGLEIRFGDKEVVKALVHKIAKREGFGDILSEGSVRAGQIIGADPDTTSTGGYGKGTDHGPIDCSAMADLTLSLSVSTRGAGHLRAVAPMAWGVSDSLPPKWQKVYKEAGAENLMDKPWISHPVKAEIATYFESICTSSDILEMCKNTTEFYYFYGYEGREKKDDLTWHADFLRAVTGMNIDREGLELITRRVLNIEKAYNVREGKIREHDMPTSRFYQKRKGGPLDGKGIDREGLEKLFDHYYAIHGWDPTTSVPKRETLEALGLGFVANELENKFGINLGSRS